MWRVEVWMIVLLPLIAMSGAHAEEECSGSSELLQLVNDYRTSTGVGALVPSATLTNAAQWKSEDMAANGYFAHDDLEQPWAQRIRSFGYPAGTYIGQNLVAVTDSPAEALAAWQASPPHNANLLEPAFNEAGVGHACVPGSEYTHYWTLDFGGRPVAVARPAAAVAKVAKTGKKTHG